MATIVRIERIYINDLAVCLTHHQCFQTVVVIIIIAVISSSRNSLDPLRGLEAVPSLIKHLQPAMPAGPSPRDTSKAPGLAE